MTNMIPVYVIATQAAGDFSIQQSIGFGMGVSIALIMLGSMIYLMFNKQNDRQRILSSLRTVTLLVRVPRESSDKEEDRAKEEKEIIGATEQFYANLSGIERKNEFVVLEIVSTKGEISFYISVPKRLHSLVEKQIHAQYPKASIEMVKEHNIFTPESHTEATQIKLQKADYLPCKTYKLLDSDPLNALANALSKLSKHEGATIQIIIRPAKKKWRTKGIKIAREMQQGKSLQDATKGMGNKIVKSSLKGVGDVVGGGIETLQKKPLPEQNNMTEMQRMRETERQRKTEPKRLTQFQEETIKCIEEKASKPAFETNIRIVVSSPDQDNAKLHIDNIANSFGQYNTIELNGFTKVKASQIKTGKLIHNYIYKFFIPKQSSVLSSEELVSIFHFPTKYTEIPNLKRLEAKQAPAPANLPHEGIIIGQNVYRDVVKNIRITRDDRRRHMYVIGKTGSGKTTIMKYLAAQDIQEGEGVCVVDPHGDFIEDMLAIIPKERAEDVVLFDPGDTDRPLGLNMLEYQSPEQKDFVVDEMIAIFHKLFPPEITGPMFEHNMRNVMLTLMSDPNAPATIAEIPRMFTDKTFQQQKISHVTDPVIKDFWDKEMAQTSDFHKSEMLGYLISKVGQFVENSMMRNIIGQQHSAFDIKDIMDKGKILLVNLSKGKTGEINSALLGLIIVSKLQMAAMSRATIPEEERKDFYLYIDEFQNFVTDSIATILSEARKYRLNLCMAHQYIAQLQKEQDTKVRDAVFGNVGSMISFKIGASDAEFMEKEYEPVFDQNDLINIERYHAYVKLMVNGQTTKPFSLRTFNFDDKFTKDQNIADAVRKISRLKYGKDKLTIEQEVFTRGRPPLPPFKS